MSQPLSPPADWKVRQVPWLRPGSVFALDGTDLLSGAPVGVPLTVGASLGKGGQAAVFALVGATGPWPSGEVVLRVAYQDEEYGRDPRRAGIYGQLAELRLTGPEDPLEGLLRLHGVGEFPAPEYLPGGGLWAQVMDWAGISLTQWLDRHAENAGGLGPERSAAVIAPVALALEHCHTAGLVHRDIKPNNVFAVDFVPDPVPSGVTGPRASRLLAAGLPFVRLGDLGSMTHAGPQPDATWDLDETDQTHTITSHIDTGPFTPPELFGGIAFGEADPAGDVWQLALTWYFACAKDLPFDGWRSPQWRTDPRPYKAAIAAGEPTARAFADLPDRMQYVLRWALSPDPRDRPTMAELGVELCRLAEPALLRSSVSHPTPDTPAGPIEAAQQVETSGQAWREDEIGDTDETRPLTLATHDQPGPGTEVSVPPVPPAVPPPAPITAPTQTPAPVPYPEPVLTRTPEPGRLGASALPGIAAARSAMTRLPVLISVAAGVLVIALLTGFLVLRHPGGSDAAAPVTPAPSSTPAVSVPPITREITWLSAPTLGGSLPQLFTGTPLSSAPVLGSVVESRFGFCDRCAAGKVRLRVDLTATSTSGNRPLGLPAVGTTPSGPYLVLVDRSGQRYTSSDPSRPVIVYPLSRTFATASYGQVALIPANMPGYGHGLTAGDTSWQTKLSSSGTSRLTFDMPGKARYVTIVWVIKDGVVGLNRFPATKQTPMPSVRSSPSS